MLAALLTPPGRGAIGVIHVCGAGAAALLSERTGTTIDGQLRLARLGRAGRTADQVMVRSTSGFTGEETIEITCHGGMVVVDRIFEELGLPRTGSAELLERGVKTGHLDRIQAEAWGLLPGALTERAARALGDQAEGALSRAVSSIQTVGDAEKLLETAPLGLALARPPRIILAGRPNAGKSTLFNVLVHADRAIVSPVAGTTRDPIRERMAIEGVPFELVDTAGIEPPRDDLERMAVERTVKALEEADLVIELIAPGDDALPPGNRSGRRLRIASKADLRAPGATGGELAVSSTSGKGLGELRRLILASFGIAPPLSEGASLVFTKRQERLLTEAVARRLDLRDACRLLLRGPAGT